MDALKRILRQGLATQAQRIKLVDGASPESTDAQGRSQTLSTEPALDAAQLDQLFGFLFPSDKATLAAKRPVKGALNVPGVGKILLLASPASPASLRLYLPPHGQAAFDADWTRLMSGALGHSDGAAMPGRSGLPPPPRQAPPPDAAASIGNAFIPAFLGEPPADEPAPPAPSPRLATTAVTPRVVAPPPEMGAFVPPGFTDAGAAPMPDAAGMPDTGAGIAFMPPDTGGGSAFMPPDIAMPPPPAPSFVAEPGFANPSFAPQAVPQPAAPRPMPMPVATPAAPRPTPVPTPAVQTQSPVAAETSGEAPVINFGPQSDSIDASSGDNPIDPILIDMVKRKASDVHITAGEPVCFRIDGDITRMSQQAVGPEQMAAYLMPIMPRRNLEEFARINDTDFAYEIRGVGRFRVNVFRDKNGVGTVMRHIPNKILTAEQLGLPPAILKFCQLTKGLVVVTGPTGSGKSTTLAAMIDMINKTRADHILTVEDPIEFVHTQQKCLVNQREVHRHTGSFSRALKAALREDPDIVLIGEMRDLETIAIAIETAETGHLVFGTLHTTTAVSTIDRIVDQFPADQQEQIRMMLASSLRGVVAQTLLKKKGGGRVAAQEILVTNDAVSAMIREGKNHMIGNHMQSQKADGNVLLNESLTRLVKENLIDPDEAIKKSVDKTSLIEMLQRLGVKFTLPGTAPAPAPGTKAS